MEVSCCSCARERLGNANQRLVTESATVVCSTIPSDVYFGSSGSLLPGIEARIVTPEGEEVTKLDTPGELWVKGPAVTLGYLNNQKATEETFVDGYLRTGDEAVVRKHPKSGHEHIFIVDRLKELIKVNVRAAGVRMLNIC
jgi:long-subunit acyl-CoA synthetase (AMP-forming)